MLLPLVVDKTGLGQGGESTAYFISEGQGRMMCALLHDGISAHLCVASQLLPFAGLD